MPQIPPFRTIPAYPCLFLAYQTRILCPPPDHRPQCTIAARCRSLPHRYSNTTPFAAGRKQANFALFASQPGISEVSPGRAKPSPAKSANIRKAPAAGNKKSDKAVKMAILRAKTPKTNGQKRKSQKLGQTLRGCRRI